MHRYERRCLADVRGSDCIADVLPVEQYDLSGEGDLQAAGELGTVWNNVYDLTAYPWLTVSTEPGKFLGAMFGWDPRPSVEHVAAYLLFLVTVAWLFLRTPRTARDAQEPVRRR